MPITYLTVDYSQRQSVKALGARWDADERKWYVPEGRDLTPFNSWLPAGQRSTEVAVVEAGDTALQAQRKSKSLSQLLAGVAEAVDRAFRQSEWTVVDVVEARVKNHVFLEVAERDANGVMLAKANAMIWATTASEILPKFEAATGMSIGAGMKLLVRARPVYSAQYGFRLIIDAVDPEFTLGELEARKREIRARLQQQGLWEANKRLEFPWDFNTVLVISPADAAGLGDFQSEARRLDRAGVCRFVYAHSRFQGPGAAEEIVGAARGALAAWDTTLSDYPDAVVFIRGGGAVNDLAWLSNYELARFVCELEIPVLTGIGHERDTTILDEVAHTRFDTPSKVIAGIEAAIGKRAREAAAAFNEIVATARRAIALVRQTAENSSSSIRAGATRRLFLTREASDRAITEVRLSAMRVVSTANESTRDLVREVRSSAATQIAVANQRVPSLFGQVRDQARSSLRTAASQSSQALGVALDRARIDTDRGSRDAALVLDSTLHDARRLVGAARTKSEALMLEIAGQGPEKTLARGFAHVRGEDGETVMSASALERNEKITITFHDGHIPAAVRDKEDKR